MSTREYRDVLAQTLVDRRGEGDAGEEKELPWSFLEGVFPAGAPATYESGPGVGGRIDAAVDHRYQPVEQPIGVGEEETLVREGQAEFEGWQSCCSSQGATPRRAQVPLSTCTRTYTCSGP